ncbi:MAG: glycoside hydrolase family 127 protein [Candidatus Bathyarchaeota archaeon]|nr:glycoside hydrolase family 127 protein [Candidatus Bathyarchaeota archaeon]
MNSKTFVADTSRSPFAKLRPVPIEAVHLQDEFWAPRLRKLKEATLPSQYELCEETGRIANFRRAAEKEEIDFQGLYFNDSDVYKWVEAAAFSLASSPDQKLQDMAHRVIAHIVGAQDEDGYLNTYFTFEQKKERWSNLRDMHELYCAGHLVQGAIAYYRATGKRNLLETACRFADHIASVFGPDKRSGASGHPEIEMALVELYRVTGNRVYLDLARFFVDKRGTGLVGGRSYHIDHEPFRELDEIVGHAVRSLYLNCGAADIYMETGDKTLWEALIRLWENMTERKMYVTGGVGSRYEGEAFGVDYELPNVKAYTETCAAIANVMWNWRMLLISGEGRFADVMELALYNGVLAGLSLDGKEYFYVNPLADRGQHRRERWFRCACCPPNIARLLASLPGYMYSLSSEGTWTHLYAQSTSNLEVDGNPVRIEQLTDYPWNGDVELVLHPENEFSFGLHLRIPGWCRKAEVWINGRGLDKPIQPGKYLEIHRVWKQGDRVQLSLPMPAERLVSNPFVMENHDRVALRRGPFIYCAEQVDNPDCDIWSLLLPLESELRVRWTPDLLSGAMVIQGEAMVADTNRFEGSLYRPIRRIYPKARRVQFTAIPYYAWANREPGPMTVWIRSLTECQKA